jgi:hypothetical protein
LSVHPFNKNECECPICEIFNLYFDAILDTDNTEDLENVIRALIRESFNEGMVSAVEQDVANKLEFLQSIDEEY